MYKIFSTFICSLCFTTVLSAELFLCNGTWTNVSCENATKTVAEDKVQVSKDENISQKRSLVRDFQDKSFQAKKEYGINYSSSSVVTRCFDRKTSYEKCEAQIEKELTRLDKEIDRKIAKNKNAKKEEPQKIKVENNTTNVIRVFDDTRFYRLRREKAIDKDRKIIKEPTNSLPTVGEKFSKSYQSRWKKVP